MKRVLAIVLTFSLLASSVINIPAFANDDFDENAVHSDEAFDDAAEYRRQAVKTVMENGIMIGYENGQFGEDRQITRAEIVTIICRISGYEDEVYKFPFYLDVPTDSNYYNVHWATSSINAATAAGVITGFPDGTFRPDESVRYEDAVKMIVCALGKEAEASADGGYPNGYLSVASKTGLDKNANGVVGTPASRETVATLLYNSLNSDVGDIPQTASIQYQNSSQVSSVDVNYITKFSEGSVSVTEVVDKSGNTSPVGIIGNAIDIDLDKSMLKEAEIKFNFDISKLNGANPNDLVVAWYDEENCRVVLLDTIIDSKNGTATAFTTHFSRYMLIDNKAWTEAWRKEQVVARDDVAEKKVFDIIFAVDNSNSMDDVFMKRRGEIGGDGQGLRKTGTYNFIKALYPEDAFSVISFYSNTKTIIPYTKVEDVKNWNDVEKSINNMKYQNGTNIDKALTTSISMLEKYGRDSSEKMIVLLTDGKNDDDSHVRESSYKKAIEQGVVITTIGLGDGVDANELIKIAEATGGEYYKATTDNLIETYQKIKQAFGLDTTDTDGDGIPDAIETAGMRNQFAKFITTDPKKSDTDGDGLLDGMEMGTIVAGEPFESATRVPNVEDVGIKTSPHDTPNYYYMMRSNPTLMDTDGDQFLDDEDKRPLIDDTVGFGKRIDITLRVNNKEYRDKAFVNGDHILVPTDKFVDDLGQNVLFDKETSTIVIQRGLDTLVFGSKDNKSCSSSGIHDFSGKYANEIIFIPLKAIPEMFDGATGTWINNASLVDITIPELTDAMVIDDFINQNFFYFTHYYSGFVNEHGDLKYALSRVLGDISGIVSKMSIGEIKNLVSFVATKDPNMMATHPLQDMNKDNLKENIRLILKNIASSEHVELPDNKVVREYISKSKNASNKLIEMYGDDTKKINTDGAYYNSFKEAGFNRSDVDYRTTSGKIIKKLDVLSNALDKAGKILKWSDTSIDILEYLINDYTFESYYLDIIKQSSIGSGDTDLINAINELEMEYADKFAGVLGKAVDLGLNEVSKSAMISQLTNALPTWGIATLVLNTTSEMFGYGAYGKNVESAVALMDINYNTMAYFTKKLGETCDYANYRNNSLRIKDGATTDDWFETVNAFYIAKAGLIEAYNFMYEATSRDVEKAYIKYQIELIKRIDINSAGVPEIFVMK